MEPLDAPLIRTRLAPPVVGARPVDRHELLRRLDERDNRKLTLVLGPAGSGKTSVLAQWRRSLLLRGAKVAWYNATRDDDDPKIAAYVFEALLQAGVDVDPEAFQMYLRSGGKSAGVFFSSLMNDLADEAGPVYLVIDDFHQIASHALFALLDRWVPQTPPHFHLVLGSRLRPPLDLAGYAAADQLTEVDFSALRFDIAETQRFVLAQGLEHLPQGAVRALHEITDGWPAGLQLLVFSLRKQKDPDAFLKRLAKSSLSQEQALNDYLARATLPHLAQDEVSFLTRISVCRRFNRELCELLTADARAGEYLARFHGESLFLLPIETQDAEPWYRFHHLLRAFLEQRLQKMPRADVAKLHFLASNWFAGKSLHVEAMRHARAAGDSAHTLDLIERSARRMVNGASFVELLRWCDAVPAEQLQARPRVMLCMAWSYLSCSRMEDFDRTMRAIERHGDRGDAAMRVEIELLEAYRLQRADDTDGCLAILRRISPDAPASGFHALLRLNLESLALAYANRFEEARDAVLKWRGHGTPDRPGAPRGLIDAVSGVTYVLEGNFRMAVPGLTWFIEDSVRNPDVVTDATGLYCGYLIDAYYHSDELGLARAFLARYSDLVDAVGYADCILFARRTQARLHELDGDAAGARSTLQRLEELGRRHALDRILAWSLFEQVALHCRQGELAALPELSRRLEQLGEKHRRQEACAWSEIPLAASLARVEIALASGDEGAALAAIDAAEAHAVANRRWLHGTRLGFIRASLLLASGAPEWIGAARSSLAKAAAFGMNRVLIDLGERAVLLVKALGQQALGAGERDYLERVRASLEASCLSADPALPASSDLRGPGLTSRELDVLRLLGKALSAKSIARMTNLSAGTVKWHLRNIYAKFESSSREDVLRKARALKLVE